MVEWRLLPALLPPEALQPLLNLSAPEFKGGPPPGAYRRVRRGIASPGCAGLAMTRRGEGIASTGCGGAQ